jgi:hypothetical protein
MSYNQGHQAELGKLSPFLKKPLKKVATSPNPLWPALVSLREIELSG